LTPDGIARKRGQTAMSTPGVRDLTENDVVMEVSDEEDEDDGVDKDNFVGYSMYKKKKTQPL
jgi:hypothetical protein